MLRLGIVTLALAATLQAQAPTTRDEDFARRQYDSGLSFMRDRQYSEALKDFRAVADGFPRSTVADDALLQIAQYQLEVARDIPAAQTTVDALLKGYPDGDSAPMGYVVAGRLTIAQSRAAADVEAALASFERVPRLFPTSDAVPAALYFAGDTLRVARRAEEALDRFRRVTAEYPRSIWSARATLASGQSLVQSGRVPRAFEEIQRIRRQFPGSPEASTALDFNTILYRLYIRPPDQPAYGFSGRFVGTANSRFRDVVGLETDDRGQVLIGHRAGVSIFDPKGTMVREVASDGPSAFYRDEMGRVAVARGAVLHAEGGEPATIQAPDRENRFHLVDEMPSVGVLSTGERLVVDRKGQTVIRLSTSGQFVAHFAQINAERLTISDTDDVAILDRDRNITITDRDGATLGRIPRRGTGYQFEAPADLAFDAVGHLYVLDRESAAVYIFGPGQRLLATITAPGREAGSLQRPRALAIDGAGRLYVYDESSQRIQVYQ